jgi:predicted SAM-dependent methyltransferase
MKKTIQEKTQVEVKLSLPIVKIDMGSGAHNMRQPLDEWIRVDGMPHENIDIVANFKSVPLPNKCADDMWSGDTIEHIPLWEMKETLGEWNRLLKIGGVFHGQTPNAHSVMMRYAKGEMTFTDAINNLYGWHDHPFQQHFVTYSTETLTELLNQYGFGQVSFAGSPGCEVGDEKNSWWLCFSCVKERDV